MKAFSKSFNALKTVELYALLKLRTDVFVVEQQCAYPELDDFDQLARHIFLVNESAQLVAYARVLPPGTVYTEASIGRICVVKDKRGKQYGKQVFEEALKEAERLFPSKTLKLQAQTYLEKFYQSFGFKTVSEPYPDFGIPHVDMLK
jgi:ElaA protein